MLWCALALLAPACASHWTLRTVESGAPLQWPYQPNKAKVTYVRSLTGFAQDRGGSTLRAFVFGREKADRNAFALPVAVATGSDGRIAVADMGRRCVHLYVPATQIYLRLDGGKEAKILSPVGVIFDDRLRLYLSDSTGKVLVFGPEGDLIRTLTKAGDTALQRPTGLAFSPRRQLVYVVDTLGHGVHAYRMEGTWAFSFGRRGEEEGRFNFPTHIFRAPSGEIYVTDSLGFRVEIFDEDGAPLGSFGRHGDGSGDLAMPKGLAVDRDGVIYVADSLFDNIQLFNRQGDFLLTVGGRGVEPGEFWLPAGVFISDKDELYVCDTYNRRIQVFRLTVPYE